MPKWGTRMEQLMLYRNLLVLSFVLYVSLFALPLGLAAQQSKSTGIHTVDFRNFAYPTNLGVIHVSNGEWKEMKEGEENYFRVVKVAYGDVNGDSQDEAVVLTASGGVSNFEAGEIYVFAMSSSGVQLLARLSPSDWGKGEEDNGGDFQVSEVHVGDRKVLVSFLAGGSHACPAWIVTATFEWNARRFIRSGLVRSRYHSASCG